MDGTYHARDSIPMTARCWDSLAVAKAEFPDLERLFQNTRAWGVVLAVIFDHRHRGNLHIKSWLLAGPLAMLQEAVVPGRQACIGTYHEPYREVCQGSARGASGEPHCWAAPACKAGQGVGACGSKTTEDQFSSEQSPSLTATPGTSSLGSALDELETACSLGVVAGCHIRAAPGGSTGAAPAATLNPGRGSNVVRSLVQLITSTSLRRTCERLDRRHR